MLGFTEGVHKTKAVEIFYSLCKSPKSWLMRHDSGLLVSAFSEYSSLFSFPLFCTAENMKRRQLLFGMWERLIRAENARLSHAVFLLGLSIITVNAKLPQVCWSLTSVEVMRNQYPMALHPLALAGCFSAQVGKLCIRSPFGWSSIPTRFPNSYRQ